MTTILPAANSLQVEELVQRSQSMENDRVRQGCDQVKSMSPTPKCVSKIK